MAERHGSFRRAACPCAWLGKGAVAPLAAGCNPVHSPKPVLVFQIYLMLGFACLVKGAPKGQHTVHTQHMGMKQGKQIFETEYLLLSWTPIRIPVCSPVGEKGVFRKRRHFKKHPIKCKHVAVRGRAGFGNTDFPSRELGLIYPSGEHLIQQSQAG